METEKTESATKTIEEDVEENIHRIAHYRKHFPRKCSQLLSKKLKMHHFMLENIKIILKEEKKSSGDKKKAESMESNTIIEFPPDIDAKLTNKIADVQDEARKLIKIIDQIKSEEECPVHKLIDI